MDHYIIAEWSKRNNLALNWSKSAEIVFSDSRKRRSEEPPLPGIARVKSLKVLGVTISNKLSVSEHVNNIISSCARSLYAIKVLRANVLCVTALQQVCKSVVVAKLYASSTRWGFASATDRQRVEAFLRRGVHSGLYPSQQTADKITDSADDKLFDCVLRNDDHVLHELLSKRVDITYNSRTRCHDRTIPEKTGHLAEKNFITRMLYKNAY